MIAELILAGFVAAAVSYLLFPFSRWVAFRIGAVDSPGNRRIHLRVTPRLGGLAILLGMAAGLSLAFLTGLVSWNTNSLWPVLMIGTPIAFLIGAWDDTKGLASSRKLLGQLLLGAGIYFLGYRVEMISLGTGFVFELGWMAFPVTLLWVAGVMNAVNLIDGVDGLAAGVASIALGAIAGLAIYYGNLMVGSVAVVACGATIGFLRFNYFPARIFMGDSGSMMLGFLLALLSLMVSPLGVGSVPVLIPILLLIVPILDMLVAILRRSLRVLDQVEDKQTTSTEPVLRMLLRSIASADGQHIHHRMLEWGMTQPQVAQMLYGFSFGSALLSFAMLSLPAPLLWLAGVGIFMTIRHLVLSLEYAEFEPKVVRRQARRREIGWQEPLGQPAAILRRVSR